MPQHRPLDDLPEETAINLLARIAPSSRILSVELMPGSFSNHTHLVEAQSPDGKHEKYVVRRYQVYGNVDRGEKARREFTAFQLMNRRGIPCPEPLLLDDTGALLGVPGIVERFVEGRIMLETPADPLEWARKAASMLARIHSIPLTDSDRAFLQNDNMEAVWFLYIPGDRAPDYMQSFPGGDDLWQLLRGLRPNLKPVPDVLTHSDFWEGNILWDQGEITAVVDWEEAAFGEPAIDLGYALMCLRLRGLTEMADVFLRTYEAERGQKVENLAFWQLAASVRPMLDLKDWNMDQPHNLAVYQQFIADTRERAVAEISQA